MALTNAEDRIGEIIRSTCRECLATGLTLTSTGPARCTICEIAGVEFSEAAVCLSVRLWLMQDKGTVDVQALKVARLLTHATFEKPIRGKLLRSHLGLTERDLKQTIERLRADWQLPIGSHRQPPYGYFWMRSPEEFKHWLRTMRAQAMTELSTAYSLYRNVYPELAGQESLDFADDFSRDLQEAIK